MAVSKRKSAMKRRNLAARALRSPLFRPKIMTNPKAYRRKERFNQKPDDHSPGDESN